MKVVLEKQAAKYLENLDAVMKRRETDLTDEEKECVREGRKHYKEHPKDFVYTYSKENVFLTFFGVNFPHFTPRSLS